MLVRRGIEDYCLRNSWDAKSSLRIVVVAERKEGRSGKLVESSDQTGCALQRKDAQLVADRADGCILFAVGVPSPS